MATALEASSRNTPSGQLVAMAGLLARGSPLGPTFPAVKPVACRTSLTAHSCGGSRGIGSGASPRSLFIPGLADREPSVGTIGSAAANGNPDGELPISPRPERDKDRVEPVRQGGRSRLQDQRRLDLDGMAFADGRDSLPSGPGANPFGNHFLAAP